MSLILVCNFWPSVAFDNFFLFTNYWYSMLLPCYYDFLFCLQMFAERVVLLFNLTT